MTNYNSLLKRNIWNDGDKTRELYPKTEEVTEPETLPEDAFKYVLDPNGIITSQKNFVLSVRIDTISKPLVTCMSKTLGIKAVNFYNNSSCSREIHLYHQTLDSSYCISDTILQPLEHIYIPLNSFNAPAYGILLTEGEKLTGFCNKSSIDCFVYVTEYQ